jgi:fluoride exporter
MLSAVATGGAIGAAGRWFIAWAFHAAGAGHVPGAWPWATLAENVVGCLLIGFAARFVQRETVSWAFVVTGVLGGFTTFSALAVELNDLAEADRMTLALLYGALTLAAGVGAVAIGTAGRYRP